MKPRAIPKPVSPYLEQPLRDLADLDEAMLQRATPHLSFNDWCDTRLTARDFIAECAHADREYRERKTWRKLFFKLLRNRLSNGEKFQDALDEVGYGDCKVECEQLAKEAEAETRAEYKHERYCRAMVGKGSGW